MDPSFHPPLKRGLILQIGAGLLLLAASAGAVGAGLSQRAGSSLALFFLIAVLLLVPAGLLIYRTYALLQARYLLDREGLRLRWGLQAEDVPLADIEWVRAASDLPYKLPLPLLSWPGAILGRRRHPDLGEITFLAAEVDTLLLVATPQRVYAISPADPGAFLNGIRQMFELGSLARIPSYSALPTFYLARVWADRWARVPLLVGAVFNLLLMIWVSIRVATLDQVSLGFTASGAPLPPVPATQLLLLPLLAGLAFVACLGLGLFFYRHPNEQAIAYMLWLSSGLSPLLLCIAMIFL